MRLKLHTVEQGAGLVYSLPVCIAGASAIGDCAEAALPGWGLGPYEVEGFNESAWGAGADPLKE